VTVSYATDGITRVRVRPLALDVVDGRPALAPGAAEVTWDSTCEDVWHQVYVHGHLAGVTARPEDRRLIVAVPAEGSGATAMAAVEVVAVDAADRSTDLGAELSGFGAGRGSRALLTWQAGEYLDAGLDSFAVYADGRTGTVDYGAAVNDAPISARPGGVAPWGYGCGGFGVGGYGLSAACYEWTTGPLEPGPWRFAVVAIDAAGNRLATAAEAVVVVNMLPRPATRLRFAAYDTGARSATIAWDASPDI